MDHLCYCKRHETTDNRLEHILQHHQECKRTQNPSYLALLQSNSSAAHRSTGHLRLLAHRCRDCPATPRPHQLQLLENPSSSSITWKPSRKLQATPLVSRSRQYILTNRYYYCKCLLGSYIYLYLSNLAIYDRRKFS